MNKNRDYIIKQILAERDKQLNLQNEDLTKTKNDWIAAIAYYLFETSSRSDKHVSFDEFRESLIKAAAIIVAALETSLYHDENLKELLDKISD